MSMSFEQYSRSFGFSPFSYNLRNRWKKYNRKPTRLLCNESDAESEDLDQPTFYCCMEDFMSQCCAADKEPWLAHQITKDQWNDLEEETQHQMKQQTHDQMMRQYMIDRRTWNQHKHPGCKQQWLYHFGDTIAIEQ